MIGRIACVAMGPLLGCLAIALGCSVDSATTGHPPMTEGAREALAHPRGWLATHGADGKDFDVACATCHQKRQCNDCHGVDMPHPKFWFVEHWAQASWKPDSVCFHCHVKKDACGPCHGLRPPG